MNANRSDGPSSRHSAEIALLEAVGRDLRAADLPLELSGVAAARAGISGVLAQLDNYLLPRLRSLDAPLLAVVGGSTGAGKSTLVNALAGRPVTRAGAVRPTTRRPVLLHHPADAGWFEDQRILPGLSRSAGDPAESADAAGTATSLTVVAEEALPSGVALLDTPDIDSVADENRRLAGELLDAADLWIFVTTANRYADAVPWTLLLDAASRDILVAVVLDRVPPDVEDEVTADLEAMLRAHGLAEALLFVVPETRLDAEGMLPALLVEPLRRWLAGIAFDAASRAEVARRTLSGAVKGLAAKVDAAAQAVQDQQQAVRQLESGAEEAYRRAAQRIMEAAQDGTLLRGEVLARWQDFVGTGEFFRTVEQNVGRLRDRIGAFLRGQPAPALRVEHAIESGLHAVIVAEAGNAAEEADRRWRSEPAGRQLLGGDDLSGPGADFEQAAASAIRDWQRGLLAMIQAEGASRRLQARMLSFGVNGAGVALMVVVFSMTGGLTGLELGIAGGSAVIGQRLLEAVFGEDAVRRLARRAREDLQLRCEALLDADRARFTDRLAGLAPGETADELREHAQSLLRLGAVLMSRHRNKGETSDLTDRLEALNRARELGEGRLGADVLAEVYQVLDRASARRSLSAEHTVVGFFGTTGSGKSSLFNAVSGTSAAVVGARRPTTADPLAAVWGPAGSEELLDWLEVPRRIHAVDAVEASEPDVGLILLDLPDFDSTAAAHRRVVERMVGMVDVLVWILDPQKYADAALHHGFLRRLAAHGAVTTVVLNQIDKLSAADLEAVTASLRSVLAQDGLGDVDILPVSARTGGGLTPLRRRIADVARNRKAAAARLTLEVGGAARSLGDAAGSSDPVGVTDGSRRRLAKDLAEAARVGDVAEAVAGSYRRESVKRTGWPLTRWLVRFRPDPLRRLNLGRPDVTPELNRTSLPAAGAPERARLDSAVRTFADEAAAGSSDPWRSAIRSAARRGRQDLEEHLDAAVARTELRSGRLAWWWPVFGVLQWLGLLAALAGAVWLAVPAVMGYLQLPVPEVPRTQGFPVPTLLLAGGLLLGVVLALAAKPLAAAGGKARAAAARRRLQASVAEVAEAVIVRPVQAELDVQAEFTECVRRAGGG